MPSAESIGTSLGVIARTEALENYHETLRKGHQSQNGKVENNEGDDDESEPSETIVSKPDSLPTPRIPENLIPINNDTLDESDEEVVLEIIQPKRKLDFLPAVQNHRIQHNQDMLLLAQKQEKERREAEERERKEQMEILKLKRQERKQKRMEEARLAEQKAVEAAAATKKTGNMLSESKEATDLEVDSVHLFKEPNMSEDEASDKEYHIKAANLGEDKEESKEGFEGIHLEYSSDQSEMYLLGC